MGQYCFLKHYSPHTIAHHNFGLLPFAEKKEEEEDKKDEVKWLKINYFIGIVISI